MSRQHGPQNAVYSLYKIYADYLNLSSQPRIISTEEKSLHINSVPMFGDLEPVIYCGNKLVMYVFGHLGALLACRKMASRWQKQKRRAVTEEQEMQGKQRKRAGWRREKGIPMLFKTLLISNFGIWGAYLDQQLLRYINLGLNQDDEEEITNLHIGLTLLAHI